MLPWRWRKVSGLTLAARTDNANEVLRNGIDRSWDGADNGVWVAPGEESVVYTWKKPVTLSGARLIFDSHFKVRHRTGGSSAHDGPCLAAGSPRQRGVEDRL